MAQAKGWGFQACYVESLKEDPTLKGKVTHQDW